MFKYSKDGISVLSVLDARRAKKSGLFPVKIQVIHNRKQKYYSTDTTSTCVTELSFNQSGFILISDFPLAIQS